MTAPNPRAAISRASCSRTRFPIQRQMEHDMIDTAAELCQTETAPDVCLDNAVVSMPESRAKTSSWGGPRPGFGGPQPGSGRPRKPKPITTYASNDPQWCAIAFWGQAEISATTELTRIGYETYMPLVAIRRRDAVIASMWHTVRVPLLPGYGFIRLTPTQSREPILATRGIREVLRRPDGRPAAVPDGAVDSLRANDAARLQLPREHRPVLAVGASVRIDGGPFEGLPATVLECDGVKTRVDVFIFGRPAPIWIDRVAVLEVV
jgi:transcription antitermination factor NusG